MRLIDVFMLCDQDHDGVVSTEELITGLEAMGVALDEADVQFILHHLDQDENGSIEYHEFTRRFQPFVLSKPISSVVLRESHRKSVVPYLASVIEQHIRMRSHTNELMQHDKHSAEHYAGLYSCIDLFLEKHKQVWSSGPASSAPGYSSPLQDTHVSEDVGSDSALYISHSGPEDQCTDDSNSVNDIYEKSNTVGSISERVKHESRGDEVCADQKLKSGCRDQNQDF